MNEPELKKVCKSAGMKTGHSARMYRALQIIRSSGKKNDNKIKQLAKPLITCVIILPQTSCPDWGIDCAYLMMHGCYVKWDLRHHKPHPQETRMISDGWKGMPFNSVYSIRLAVCCHASLSF